MSNWIFKLNKHLNCILCYRAWESLQNLAVLIYITIKITLKADFCFHIVMYLDFFAIQLHRTWYVTMWKNKSALLKIHHFIDWGILSSPVRCFHILKYQKHTIKIMFLFTNLVRPFNVQNCSPMEPWSEQIQISQPYTSLANPYWHPSLHMIFSSHSPDSQIYTQKSLVSFSLPVSFGRSAHIQISQPYTSLANPYGHPSLQMIFSSHFPGSWISCGSPGNGWPATAGGAPVEKQKYFYTQSSSITRGEARAPSQVRNPDFLESAPLPWTGTYVQGPL